jgi:Bifunctional DNA primase/polymerase, N-terminal
MTSATKQRLALRANEYAPIPARGKACFLPGWQTKANTDPGEIEGWARLHPDWYNTGVLTERTPGLDIDIKHPEAAASCEEYVREVFDGHGTLITRFGNPPKRALLFQTDEPFSKIRADFTGPNGDAHHIELLCAGQQIIVEGVNPDSKRAYSWHGKQGPLNVRHSELPCINEDIAAALIEGRVASQGF